jgi:ABC-2 type transport system permease protein
MRNILLIAKREYLEQIRGRAFKFSTIIMPLLIAALLGFSHYMDHKANTGKHIAIVADDAALANQVRQQMLDDKWAQYKVDVTAPATAEQRDELKDQVRAKQIDGVLAIDASDPQKITATITSLSVADASVYGGLQNALNRGIINERMIARGMSQAEADAVLG